MSIPTVFLRTNSLPSTWLLLWPYHRQVCLRRCIFHLPVTAIAPIRARWASPKSRSNEATDSPCWFDLFMPRLSSLWRKKEKKESWALASARAARHCSNFKQRYAAVDSALGAHAFNAPDRDNVQAHAEQCHIHANRPGRYAARCRSRIPPCPNVSIHICVHGKVFKRKTWQTSKEANPPYAKFSAILDYRGPPLESSFVSFATTRLQSTCTCTSIQILAKFVAWSCERLDGFPCSFRCRSVWIRKLVAVRVVAFDTSGPMATNCGDVVSAEAEKKGAA